MFLSEWREFFSAHCFAGKKIDDSSRLDVVEIARVPDILPSLFPSWSGQGLTGAQVTVSVQTATIYRSTRRHI